MADAPHDDLADALARLAGGDVAPSERDHEPPPPAKVTFRQPAPAARPQRPAAPTVRSLAPPPLDLTPPPPADDLVVTPIADEPAVDDDDVVIVPAPDASVFIPKRKPVTTAAARAAVVRRKRVEFRRTIIPVLLTCGVLMIGFGLLPLLLGPDSVAAALPPWVTPTLLGLGVVLLGLAGANMASVRSLLAADATPG